VKKMLMFIVENSDGNNSPCKIAKQCHVLSAYKEEKKEFRRIRRISADLFHASAIKSTYFDCDLRPFELLV